MTKEKQDFQKSGELLVRWYQKVKRDLPWRHTKEAYPIWISETMLQQTRVETVRPYYERFLTAFPTPEALAAATEEEVLSLWQGLGYYSRARNLQAGVRELVEVYGGKLPRERKEVEKLRGVGPYTAGALLSLVYGLPEPAVDGNVYRVITRFSTISEPIDVASTRKIVSEVVSQMIPVDQAGDFNQALMELGATLCSPRSPRCMDCPIHEMCWGYKKGNPVEFPKKSPPKPPKLKFLVAGVLIDQGKVLLRKRPSRGLLAKMWEFPTVENLEDQVVQALQECFAEAGVEVEIKGLLCGVDHIFSHQKWDLRGFEAKLTESPIHLPEDWAWHEWNQPEKILWAGPHSKIANFLQNGEKNLRFGDKDKERMVSF